MPKGAITNVLFSLFFVILLTLAAFPAFAQTQDRLLSLTRYADIVMADIWNLGTNWKNDRVRFNNPAIDQQFAGFQGNLQYIDTALEAALVFSYCFNVTPPYSDAEAAAEAILPHNNPVLVDRQLGAHVYMGLIVSRFFNDTAAVTRHEAMLQFITSRGNTTRAEIEAFYRNGIRGLVADIVNEEFNKISFMIDRNYNAVLIRNPQTGHYTLQYEGVNNYRNELSATSLETLSSAMSGSRDFSATAFNQVREQAALIPSVVYADWKSRNVAGGVDALALIADTLTNFMLNPNQQTYEAVRGICARYLYILNISGNTDRLARGAYDSYMSTIGVLGDLGKNIDAALFGSDLSTLARIPNDARFNVFSTRF